MPITAYSKQIVFLLLVVSSCRQKTSTQVVVDDKATAIAPANEINSMSEFYPLIWEDEYELRLSQLPKSGKSDRLPYAGSWYPYTEGGTNRDVSGSGVTALQKYDRAMNPSGSAASWELSYHGNGESWHGHCNGWSAAASRHLEPDKDVVRNGITFTPLDVKALLAEVYMKAIPVFVGGRRCNDGNGEYANWRGRANYEYMERCEDINPGIFHAGLANILGRKKHVMILDIQANHEVWNYPAFQYSSSYDVISEEIANELVSGQARSYQFNRSAKNFYRVSTTVSYRKATRSEARYNSTDLQASKQFQYILETDANDKIVGGEWIEASVSDHPDFLWLALQPMYLEEGRAGEDSAVNPFLSPKEVLRLWAESAGFDPDNPPEEIMMPTDQEVRKWGKFEKFTLALDGNERGAVFSGKNVNIVINRTEKLNGGVNIGLTLNNVYLGDKFLNGDESKVIFEAKPDIGLNNLSIAIYKDNVNIDDKKVVFHTSF